MKTKNVFLGIAKFLLCILLCLSVVLAFASSVLGFFFSAETYKEKIITEEYVAEMSRIMLDNIESEALFYDVPIEYVSEGIDNNLIHSLSGDYIVKLITAFKTGSELPTVTYPEENFKVCIEKYLDENPDISAFYEESTVDELATAFGNVANDTLNNFMNISALEQIVRQVYSNEYLALLADSFYWIIAFAVIIGVLIIVLSIKNISAAFYSLCASVWCGAALLFVPVKLICDYDFPSKLALGEGPFKLMIDGMIYYVTGEAYNKAEILFIVSSVALLISVILAVCLSLKRELSREKIDEEN